MLTAATLWLTLLAVDSLDILRDARRAQRDFERVRRNNLPYDWDHQSGPCDVRVGRFCYWYHPSPNRPPEPRAIGRARGRLLRELEAAAARLPGDDWILGQRVRYLVEHRQAGRAVTLAGACGGSRWWCDALEGFARHAAGDYGGADQAFERALAGMPEQQRCDWTDLSSLLQDAQRYRRLSCAERVTRGERIWWLADPLYSMPGNDLRTEHYARQTMALLLEDAANTYGLVWGGDMQELLVRFGWPTDWSRSLTRSASLDPPTVVGHEPDPSYWLFPRPVFTEPWSDRTEVRWEPTTERPPARYALPYATGLVPITGVQFARFRRGDTTLTIAALDLTADSGFAGAPLDLRFAVARDPRTPAIVRSVRGERSEVRGERSDVRGGRSELLLAGPRTVVAVRSLWRPAVLSLEVMKGDTGAIGWRRVIVPPDPGGLPPVLSDILLLGPTGELPRSLDEAAAAALRPAQVRKGQRVGLYWETYALPDSAQPLEVSVTVTKARSKHESPYPVGRPQCPPRIASPVTVRWQEEPEDRARGVARSIGLDLRRLSRGRYVVAIQISEAGRPRGCSSRELEIK